MKRKRVSKAKARSNRRRALRRAAMKTINRQIDSDIIRHLNNL